MNIARKFEFFQSKKSRCLSYDFKGGDLSSEGGLLGYGRIKMSHMAE